jgi:hypothetical protein
MLLTRLGIFSKVDDNTVYIYNKHAVNSVFPNNIPVYEDDLIVLNDVILDKIEEINIVDIANYPKVYDLTIPSTLNFGLANGLQVRDTSETGYIQRKLVKAMEDAVIATDYTVRNSNGTILQFLYGEDGFDGTKIEKQKLTTLSQGNKQILEEHMLPIDKTLENKYIPEIAEDILANKEYIETQFKHHIDQLVADRDYYFHRVFKGMVLDDYVFLPINFTRIIDNAATNFPLIEEDQDKIAYSDLHPSYVLTNIEQLAQTIKITDEHKGNELVMVLARIHLSPQMLYKKRIGKIAFDYIIANIIQTFYASVAHPGELVGTISAQSLGEPTTQLTLNKVLLRTGGLKRVLPPSVNSPRVY